MSAIKHYQHEGEFRMRRGAITAPTFAYETWGELDARASNAVLIFTGLSPSAHVASCIEDPSSGWWEDMVGPDKPIDTNRYFVSLHQLPWQLLRLDRPRKHQPRNRQTLPARLSGALPGRRGQRRRPAARSSRHRPAAHGGRRLHGRHDGAGLLPAVSRSLQKRLIAISSAARSLPFSIAVRSLQREMIRTDPGWQNGQYDFDAGPDQWHAPGQKTGDDLISKRRGMDRAVRSGAHVRRPRRAVRHRLRGGVLSGGTRQQVHRHFRPELLPLSLPGHGSVRRHRPRRQPASGPFAGFVAKSAGDRRGDRLSCSPWNNRKSWPSA